MTFDSVLFNELRRDLFTAVIGDVLDRIGLRNQFLPPDIHALRDDMVAVGTAMTVVEADLAAGEAADGFGLLFQALDDLKAGELYVCTGASPTYALWGGLMSTRAARLGAVGAVLDGFHRDTREILDLGFPLFSKGAYAQDQQGRGKVVDFRVPIEFRNGCRVASGDLLFADVDGVVVVPRDAAEEVIRLAREKVSGEAKVRRMIVEGQTTEKVFRETGIM